MNLPIFQIDFQYFPIAFEKLLHVFLSCAIAQPAYINPRHFHCSVCVECFTLVQNTPWPSWVSRHHLHMGVSSLLALQVGFSPNHQRQPSNQPNHLCSLCWSSLQFKFKKVSHTYPLFIIASAGSDAFVNGTKWFCYLFRYSKTGIVFFQCMNIPFSSVTFYLKEV